MSTSIRKVVYSSFGDPSVVSVVKAEHPAPADNEVQIRVIYAGMGGADIAMRLGVYPFQKKAPLTPGYSCVGRVEKNGAKASKFKVGDLVGCLTIYDSEAELNNQPEKYLIPIPEGVDLQQAVALILDWATSYDMAYHHVQIKAGQRIFVHGLSGAVGTGLVTFLKKQGAEVYGTASERNFEAVRALGATPFTYANKDWIQTMKELGGADVVYDPLGFESWDESWSILNPKGGRLVGFGGNQYMLNGRQSGNQIFGVIKLLAKGYMPFSKHSTSFFGLNRDAKNFEPDVRELLRMLQSGEITVPIRKVWTLDEVPEAHRQWAKGPGIGAIVIKVAE